MSSRARDSEREALHQSGSARQRDSYSPEPSTSYRDRHSSTYSSSHRQHDDRTHSHRDDRRETAHRTSRYDRPDDADRRHRTSDDSRERAYKSRDRRDDRRDPRGDDRSSRKHSSRRSRTPLSESESSDASGSRRRSSHRHEESREERRARKEAKRVRREAKATKKAKKLGVVGHEYGSRGILNEADIFTKDMEFNAWLMEERKINPETVTHAKRREMFKIFAEDYNTVTLPHEKYYNLEAYEKRMSAVRMGETVEDTSEYDFRKDEEALRKAGRAPTKQSDTFLTREQLEDLRKIERQRIEASKMKTLGLEVKQSMGVRYEDG
ncbi:uncharacterized protein L969DRAFT_53362 [Mixia osmundae IAM 14324]|uniref:uncharacterized protein n=1 Tax=Mixia osmundae (strain CBS 9802 / IAM 14324 / JCM 22182 / KY 12970) TaxID=764103 RepID=UPI0004A549A0|nr:uncharacterized protein L969DRAFT_53362 [Mixia osmundae IAM 14324]KEI37378.1 hypothetical protein L969DRAFT_53362 [Mixia osmundae IAM 14324]